ncbi:methylated-DNA--[protein]-cysteine S-methyltransferase [Salinicola halophilus]|uniref:methylated-DNA--[protein]-cysteine S-methyltransferase n=1 Tax=Salinicola halophilus TaxID=184065 RepID=UPI000DA14A61|nr:methylated-DNA--[protein]-cysteine S-methyltransferase [Salinicola halophilus]
MTPSPTAPSHLLVDLDDSRSSNATDDAVALDYYQPAIDVWPGALEIQADTGGITRIAFVSRAPAVIRPSETTRECIRQLQAYFAGELQRFELPLAPRGTDFQQRVWHALATIPWGETRSYRELAVAIDRPTASRAVGMANGRNPLAIVVPCHRVIGTNGTLTGYAGGLERKRWLLQHEGWRQP